MMLTTSPYATLAAAGRHSGLRESQLVVGLHPKAADVCRSCAAWACRSRWELNLPALASRGPLECATDQAVRTEWEARRAQRGVSGREHVRGRITVPQGDASGLFSPYAQFNWRIDRYGSGVLDCWLRVIIVEYGHLGVDVG